MMEFKDITIGMELWCVSYTFGCRRCISKLTVKKVDVARRVLRCEYDDHHKTTINAIDIHKYSKSRNEAINTAIENNRYELKRCIDLIPAIEKEIEELYKLKDGVLAKFG